MLNSLCPSRSRWLVVLLLVVGAAIVSAAVLWPRRAGPFWDKYQRVQMRMTGQEVKDILGPSMFEEVPGGSLGPTVYAWKEGEQTIGVSIDFLPGDPLKEGVVEKWFVSPMLPRTSETLTGS
jgi:hypothetical protein